MDKGSKRSPQVLCLLCFCLSNNLFFGWSSRKKTFFLVFFWWARNRQKRKHKRILKQREESKRDLKEIERKKIGKTRKVVPLPWGCAWSGKKYRWVYFDGVAWAGISQTICIFVGTFLLPKLWSEGLSESTRTFSLVSEKGPRSTFKNYKEIEAAFTCTQLAQSERGGWHIHFA